MSPDPTRPRCRGPAACRRSAAPPRPRVSSPRAAPPLLLRRARALDALRLRRGLRDPLRRPERWTDAAFGREVELIRRHLAPLRNRRSLTASFEREAFHRLAFEPPASLPLGPIRAAYAIRWLELGSGAGLPTWSSLLATDRV
ncbi:MAG: hypothetical protein HY262_02410 [Chloroflexi bacterium]|nr:hypothetical protein [Chloroflexota bacterium]